MRGLLAGLLALPLFTLPLVAQRVDTSSVVLRDVTVVDVKTGALQPGRTILIRGNRIAVIGPVAEVAIPAGATVVPGTGRYLIPGLWDAHVHSAASTGWHFPLFVANGITAVRNMHSTSDTALGLTNAIKRRVASGALLGPRMLANGPIIDGEPGSWEGAVVVHDAAGARAAVDSLAAGGADFIKVYDNLTREEYLAITREAKSVGIPVDGHLPFQVPPEMAAAARQRTIEHLSGMTMGCSSRADSLRAAHLRLVQRGPLPFPQGMIAFFQLVRSAIDSRDSVACARTAELFRREGVVAVPTLVMAAANPARLQDPDWTRGLPPAIRREWESMAGSPAAALDTLLAPGFSAGLRNLRLLHAAGVTILAGTDVGNLYLVPGTSLHTELTLLVTAGLTPLEALRAATLNPARVFGMADSLGTIEEGKLADLVLLDANPLDDIANTQQIRGVVLNGRYLSREALAGLVARAARKAE